LITVRQTFRTELSNAEFFRTSTVSALAAMVDRGRALQTPDFEEVEL
jgi:hypothetical protein